jgi:S1-C subfamily serine protease
MCSLSKLVLVPVTVIALGLGTFSSADAGSPNQGTPRQGNARQGKVRQGNVRQGSSRQGLAPYAQVDPSPRYSLGIYCRGVGSGVKVVGTVPGGAGERVGLEVGDIIVSVDGMPIADTSDLHEALQSSDGYVRLRVRDVRTARLTYCNVDLSR